MEQMSLASMDIHSNWAAVNFSLRPIFHSTPLFTWPHFFTQLLFFLNPTFSFVPSGPLFHSGLLFLFGSWQFKYSMLLIPPSLLFHQLPYLLAGELKLKLTCTVQFPTRPILSNGFGREKWHRNLVPLIFERPLITLLIMSFLLKTLVSLGNLQFFNSFINSFFAQRIYYSITTMNRRLQPFLIYCLIKYI